MTPNTIALLRILEYVGKAPDAITLQKLVFLAMVKSAQDNQKQDLQYDDFVKTQHGVYSESLANDLESLDRDGLITYDEGGIHLTSRAIAALHGDDSKSKTIYGIYQLQDPYRVSGQIAGTASIARATLGARVDIA